MPRVCRTTRRTAIATGIAVAAGGGLWWARPRKPPLGMDLPEEYLRRGAALLADNISVDVHSHSGRSFLVRAEPDSFMIRMMRDGFEAERIADMQKANVTASIFSIVADFALLGLGDGGLRAVREFELGEAYEDFKRQLDRLREIVGQGLIRLAHSPDELRAAKLAGQHVAILASEGGDFIEDRLERLEEAHAAGLRSVTLVHYHVNRLADIQTEPPVHNGLTRFGRGWCTK